MRKRTEVIAFGLMTVVVLQFAGCQPIQIPVPYDLDGTLGTFLVEAGVPSVNRGVGALGESQYTIGSGSIELDPNLITFVPADTTNGKGAVNLQATTTLTVTVSVATAAQIDIVCEDGDHYGPFEVTLDEDYVPVSVNPPRFTLSQNTVDLLNGDDFSICIVVESPIDGTVTIEGFILNLGL